jgi:alpha-glucosidase
MDKNFYPYTASIHHDGSSRYVRSPHAGEIHLGEDVEIRLRTAPRVPVDRILIRTCPDGEQQFTEMQREGEGLACTWWKGLLHISMPLVNYRFLLFTSDGVWWYNGRGMQRHNPTDAEDFRLLAEFSAPSWVHDSVFYQIFPDRFANGNPAISVREGEFEYRGYKSARRQWGEPPSPGGEAALVEFYGGDLLGIESHLDYLADLGVNALYLTPVFTSFSNHRYDVVDYYNVDPHLGGNSALASLRLATRQHGMNMILDIVPNHCGVMHPWFQAAQKDLHSPTAEYFTFFHHPQDYACWLGARSLPKLNYRSTALREVMYKGKDSIFRHWMRLPYAIDGWRLDVANMLAR